MSTELTNAEENYLKAIYKLSLIAIGKISNVELAGILKLNPPTVLEMVRRLQKKNLLRYNKKTGVILSEKGKKKAIQTIRKHRLWEVFLHEKLGFRWDEVHQIAEQLEHVQSDELLKRLDKFLEYPKFDPHGDPIPNANGKLTEHSGIPLSKSNSVKIHTVVGVKNNDDSFLKLLGTNKIQLGSQIKIMNTEDFDQSMKIKIDKKYIVRISKKVSENLLVI
ncbi:MAG: metal-dependent transcriptional regulator [Bacteroidota bacterium]